MTTNGQDLVYGAMLSTVVPGRAIGDGKVHELSPIDLAMKLHYLKGVYFFTNDDHDITKGVSFFDIHDLKNSQLFDCLEPYFLTCGRVRASEEGGTRPIIKLNDAGIRIVEAQASKTMEEWLAMDNFASNNDKLVYAHVLGPDLGFTPLVFIQVTWFKCGGISVGLSWAHILGDAFSASTFMNELGHYLKDQKKRPIILGLPKPLKSKYQSLRPSQDPLSVKRVDPVGDCWVAPNNSKMGTHSFQLTQQQLSKLHSSIHGPRTAENPDRCFELISAILWKSIAKIKNDLGPKVVTVLRPNFTDRQQVIPYNGQVIGTVKAQGPNKVSMTNVQDLENLIFGNMVDESDVLEELVEKEMSNNDFVVYGANLTLVDLEEVDVYGFELKGKRAVFASYSVNGIGDEGAVFLLPGPNPSEGTKLIIVTLPYNELEHLKVELKEEWCIV